MRAIWHYHSPLGNMTMASDGEVLTGLWFDGQKHFGAGLEGKTVELDLPVFRETVVWLERYFAGKRTETMPLIRMDGTAFQKQVWNILLTIPYGHTMTYGEIAAVVAEQKGVPRISAQAVGGAVGRNPVSVIVPCHRVIGRDGSLTGYAGGLERKRWLLELESRP